MLRSLRIKNLALVDDLTWELEPGFNILTGETGAGKSILIDALNLLLGERADKTLIRTGETTCTVEGAMELSRETLKKISPALEEFGAEACEGVQLLLKRTLATTGTNRQFINGSPVTLQALQAIGNDLVDVHGPHDHQSLLSVDRQLGLLDAYGKLELLRSEYAEAYEVTRKIAEERASLALSEQEREERIERLRYQVNEIQGARLKPGDDVEVERDFKVGANARQLVEYASEIARILNEADEAVLIQLSQVERRIQAWEKLDPSLTEKAASFREAVITLQSFVSEIQSEAERIDLDGGRLKELEERLNLIHSLKRKYGGTLEVILEKGETAARQLESLESHEGTLARLQQEEAASAKKRDALASKLSKERQKIAAPLGEKIQKELRLLGFSKASFQVECHSSGPGPSGIDRIEFIFAPNVGEAPRPLRAIASSGEMARVMLAIKTTLAEVDEVPILIFDEIDANVGGETASQVGKKLRSLGGSHQVLCITHLPQVAAQGRSHYCVQKEVQGGRTATRLTVLEGKSRAQEIARMLGGQSDQSLALAKALLEEK